MRHIGLRHLTILALLVLSACAPTKPHPAVGRLTVAPPPVAPITPTAYTQTGVASFYADHFHGKKTASGEIMDQNALTAASKHLPMGTRVRVTNTENGRSVVVEVNDRGPFVPGRIIDLSKRAAAQLDMHQDGVTKVTVEAVITEQPNPELKQKIERMAMRKAARQQTQEANAGTTAAAP